LVTATAFLSVKAKGKYVILSASFRLEKRSFAKPWLWGHSVRAEAAWYFATYYCRCARGGLRHSPQQASRSSRYRQCRQFFQKPGSGSTSLSNASKLQYPGLVAFPDKGGMKLAAGWLIEQAGWKGYRQGDAGVHPLQALVLVNHGTCNRKRNLHLSEKIKISVFEQFGVELETEVNII
jgi:UDP-N-acetylenolpyruvoylglucosamine reductase